MSKLGLFLFITSAFMIDYQYEYALYLKNGGVLNFYFME